MKPRRFLQFQDMIVRIHPELIRKDENGKGITAKTVTFQVTDRCNLACKYCYQINKSTRRMSLDTAKKFVDLILTGDKGMEEFLNLKDTPTVIFEFIGGEPFLEIDLISDICEYIFDKMVELDHPWLSTYAISICSNGVLYSDPKVQTFLNRYKNKLSFSITIDGNKELHDSCRVFPDGSPSYDIAVAGAQDWIRQGNYMGSKITIAPGNISHLYSAILHMLELGYTDIHANTVYEKGWTLDHAKLYYSELKRIADYFIDHELYKTVFLALFSEDFFRPKPEHDNENWCGSVNAMIACDPDGKIFTCIRFMGSSLGDKVPEMSIGDVDNGIGYDEKSKCNMDCIHCVTRRSQSTDQCFYCPIAAGCSWCTGHNYQETGTPNKRVEYSCDMHKARALANAYYWGKVYEACPEMIPDKFGLFLPDSESLKIISEDELNEIKSLDGVIDYSECFRDYFTENHRDYKDYYNPEYFNKSE